MYGKNNLDDLQVTKQAQNDISANKLAKNEVLHDFLCWMTDRQKDISLT